MFSSIFPNAKQRNLLSLLLLLLITVIGVPLLRLVTPLSLWQRLQTFVTIFLGIFIEAVPFLAAGALVSGLISEFVDAEMIQRYMPRHPLVAAVAGALLGLAFPVCECGVVPVTRRLYQKGLPTSTGISFLLAAPIINPVVIASTFAAYGWSMMFWGRIIIAFCIAVIVGLFFHWTKPETVFRHTPHAEHQHDQHCACHTHAGHAVPAATTTGRSARLWRALSLSGDEFLEMAHYLIIGCLMAAYMQVLIPQSLLISWGRGPVGSVGALMILAFVLSVCSTVDAFISLAFVNTFAPGAVLAFLIFGPMVDIKSLLLFRQVFNRRTIIYLVVLPMLLTGLAAVAYNIWGV